MIEGGTPFASSIAEALDKVDAVIVLWSQFSVASDWVRDEAARGRSRKRLVPLSIEGTMPPLGFGHYQVIKLSKWRGKRDSAEFQAIVRAILAAAGRKVAPAPPARAALSRRTVLLAGTGAGAAVLAGGLLLVDERRLLGGGSPRPDSIAVLPFKNLSGDEAQAYLSGGLTEAVRAALVRTDSLRVLATTSSNAAEDSGGDSLAFARKVGVTYLLEGSVRRAGDTVRISTVLTDGKTGFGLWSKTFDKVISDIFAVEDEIAGAIAAALSVRVATAKPAPGGTRHVAAYESYLRGRAMYNQAKDEPTDRAALAAFDLAIAADPNFAMAYAARSRSLASIAAEYAKADQLKPLYDAAIAAARRAVELAPDMAEGHLALGYALFAGRLDVKGARPSYDKAVELGRGNADILLLFALYCSRAARANEARMAIRRALVLDPLNARTHRAAGSIEYAARRYRSALPPLKQAMKLNPDMTYARALMGYCLLQLGELKEARAAFAAEPLPAFRLSGLAITDHRLGNSKAAGEALDQLVEEAGDSALFQQAEVHAQLGNPAAAIAALERARVVGDSGLTYLATDPLLDPIRSQPRFVALIKDLDLS
jgi:TolB-like protein/Flp pilus assembly protein TadD